MCLGNQYTEILSTHIHSTCRTQLVFIQHVLRILLFQVWSHTFLTFWVRLLANSKFEGILPS